MQIGVGLVVASCHHSEPKGGLERQRLVRLAYQRKYPVKTPLVNVLLDVSPFSSCDTIYRAEIKPKDDGYVVNFAYGRRGGNMTTGTKTKSPVPLDEAKTIYNKLISEKTAKGYTREEHGTPSKPKRMKWKFEVENVSHCQFFIEPKVRLETCFAETSDQEWCKGFNLGQSTRTSAATTSGQ